MATDVIIAVGTRGVSAAARQITSLDSRTSKLGKTLAGIATGGAVLAAAAVGKFAIASVQAASKSQQSIGATQTVYGRFAKQVIRDSKRAADSVGLSANEYRELANVTGASLQAAGIPLRKTTELTADLNKRAADMAATLGGTTREAIEAVSSALRGETDPIERYGVSIKEADVNARLAAQGQDKLTGAAGKQAAMMARLDLVFGQTQKSAGAFARESDTLAGAQQRLDAKIENVQAKFGKLLLPALTAGVNLISRKVIPAAEDLATWLGENQDEITSTAVAVKNGLLPPLQALGSIAKAAAQFVAGLPPELQSLAAQAAVAAVVLPRLTSAMSSAALPGFIGNLRNAETRLTALGGAARQAAGIGGVLGIAHGAQQSSKALGTLETTAGGALLGFSLAGPWGAAIGAGAGALGSLWQATRQSNEALADGKAKAEAYANQLDAIAAASGRARREEILRLLEQENIIGTANSVGISTQQLIAALSGNGKAIDDINKKWRENSDVLTGLKLGEVRDFLQEQGFELRRSKAALEDHEKALKRWDGKVGQSAGKVDGANRQLGKLGNVNPSNKWIGKFVADLDRGNETARRGAGRMNDTIWVVTGRAKPNMSPFGREVGSFLDGLRGTARTKSAAVGAAMGSGLVSGIGGAVLNANQAMINLVNQAIAAGKNAAKSKSPSRRTMELGRDLGRGLEKGMKDHETKTAQAAVGLVEQLLKAARDSSDKLEATVRRVLEKHGLKEKQLRKALKAVSDETKALAANAAAHAKVATALTAARDRLKEARAAATAYSNTIRDAVVATGDITTLGLGEEGTATSAGILSDLRDRVEAAKRFAALIEQLRPKLNRTSLDQLIAKGVEGGLTTAEALVAGGPAVIAQVNSLTKDLTAAGQGMGDRLAQQMHGAGVAAAQGVVRGLESQQRAIERQATKLANALAAAVRKALKIKSPSRVFEGIGSDVLAGLSIGLDETYVTRQGRALAGSLVDGFADPKLTARTVFEQLAAGSGSGATVTVKLSAAELSQLERGRSLQLDIDASQNVGFRRQATA